MDEMIKDFLFNHFDLWLVAYAHRDNPRWVARTNYWSPLDVLKFWRYGYRRFKIQHYRQ